MCEVLKSYAKTLSYAITANILLQFSLFLAHLVFRPLKTCSVGFFSTHSCKKSTFDVLKELCIIKSPSYFNQSQSSMVFPEFKNNDSK